MTKKQITKQALVYQAKDGAIELKLDKKNKTILANLNQIAELFGVQKAAISKHLNKIFKEGDSVVSILETTTAHGAITGKTQIHKVNFYNLDAILEENSVIRNFRITAKDAKNSPTFLNPNH